MSIEGKAGNVLSTSDLSGAEAASTQYAALCWRRMGEKVEVLLVTSRDTGRWIIPKGWPIKGLTPWGTAQQEAYEEAGVEGRVGTHCAGLYSYVKVLGPDRSGGKPCVVAVYPLQVRKMLDSFPERSQRRRKWFTPKKAACKVEEPELKALLREFTAPAAREKGKLAGKAKAG